MGTSLGANTTLEAAAIAPERLRGMVIEMPVLDGALVACGIAFMPPLLTLKYAEPVDAASSQAAARAVPRGLLGFLGDIVLDTVRQDPEPSASVLEGLFFGRIAPHRYQRRTFDMPALVIGHPRDPVHPFSDAGMLADELPNGRLLEASSILELRLAPERLTNEIADFIDECWASEQPGARIAGRLKDSSGRSLSWIADVASCRREGTAPPGAPGRRAGRQEERRPPQAARARRGGGARGRRRRVRRVRRRSVAATTAAAQRVRGRRRERVGPGAEDRQPRRGRACRAVQGRPSARSRAAATPARP